jgi:DNA-binding LacI/PurR family transcriptional regulator
VKNRRPTQKDVAKLAGVSVTTVSQVLNARSGGNIRISEQTRARVWQAIEDLGYAPNVSARSLRTQKTHLLAVMVPDITNPFYPELIRGVQGVATEFGYDLLVYDADDRPTRETAFVDAVLRRQVDGVVMVPFYLQRDDVQRLTAANIPVAVTMKDLASPGVDELRCDDTAAMDALITHLVEKGHRRIAHLSGTMDTLPGRERLAGYRRALEQAEISFDEGLVCHGNFRSDSVPGMIDRLLSPGKEPPTAIFAANDVMAIAAIYALRRRGLRVPEDIAVCGYDDIPESSQMIPALTTVNQKTEQIGKLLAGLLIERLEKDAALAERQIPFEFEFVVREST